jgi:hypothetical protein
MWEKNSPVPRTLILEDMDHCRYASTTVEVVFCQQKVAYELEAEEKALFHPGS